MMIRHVALSCGDETQADKFYQDLLGLTKSELKTLPRSLSNIFFKIDRELTVINYQNDFTKSLFIQTNLTDADFVNASCYSIDITLNKVKNARFSLPDAVSLLYLLDIEIVDE